MSSPTAPPGAQTASADSRSRAVSAFMQGGEQSPVQNQNQVAPEEMRAIKAQSEQSAPIDEQDQVVTEETVETPEVPVEDPAVTRQFAKLAQQERALRAKIQQQESQFQVREAAIKAKEASLQVPQTDMSKYISKDMFKQDAVAALAEAGMSYEEITQQIMNQQPTDPRVMNTINKLQAKIDALEEQTKTSQKSYQEQQTAAYQAAVKQIELDVKTLVNSDPQYETIKHTAASKDVVELITETYNKDGYLLTVEEAAQQVEEYLADKYTKVANINKIKARINKASATPTQSTTKQTPVDATKQAATTSMKTLTNANSSTRQLSAKERAVLAFKGELK